VLLPRARVRLRLGLLRYFVRELVSPTAFALAGFTLVVLIQDLLGYADLVINRGLGLGTVAWIAFYQTLPLIAETLPFAVLVGALAALGRLGADRELLALENAGFSPLELVAPVAFAAALATLGALALALVGSPAASRALDALLDEIARERPGAVIRAGTLEHFGEWKLEAQEVSGRGDRMRGVMLWVPDVGETLFAERGSLAPGPDASTEITLEQGTVVLDPRRQARRLDFERLTAVLPEAGRAIPREPGEALAGARLGELIVLARGSSPDPEQARSAAIELQRRFALPAATWLFGFLALPLLLVAARFSRSAGALLGILTTVAYYSLVQLGDGLIQNGALGVVAGVWLPDVALAALALALAVRCRSLQSYGRPPPRAHRVSWGRHARPSRLRVRRFVLVRYVDGRFVVTAGLAFLALVVAYLLVDVCEHLTFFARYSASGEAVIRYYAARLPLLASRVVPISLLLAAGLTVGLLAAANELLGMRACGISGMRAMAPVLVLCALISPLYYALDNKVVPQATALWHYVKNVEIRDRVAAPARGEVPIWYRVKQRVYEIERLDPDLGTASGITYYDVGRDGLPIARVDARSGRYVGNGVWRLEDPVRVELDDSTLRRVSAQLFAELGDDVPAEVDTRELSVGELRREIRVVEESGYDATPYRVDFYAKLTTPLACFVLPALALFFALRGPPYPNPAHTLLFSITLAVGYVLSTGVSQSLGYGGALPAPVAGAGPTLLLFALSVVLGRRSFGFGRG
jgi:LPS export ABC transporter permease LptG